MSFSDFANEFVKTIEPVKKSISGAFNRVAAKVAVVAKKISHGFAKAAASGAAGVNRALDVLAEVVAPDRLALAMVPVKKSP